jgi:uncharacterized membrane-anchored protein
MIRVVVFLIAAGLLALGVVWLADRPGQVAITWLGYRADTSVMVGVVAIIAVAIVSVLAGRCCGSCCTRRSCSRWRCANASGAADTTRSRAA